MNTRGFCHSSGSPLIGGVWSFETTFFALQDPQLLTRARREHPIPEGAQYWVHKEESVLGELFTRTAFHLWQWDGEEYDLLAEGFAGWIS
jgi:hypothetical protein